MMVGLKGFLWDCGGLHGSAAATFSKGMYFEKTFKKTIHFFFFLETCHKDGNDIANEWIRCKDTHQTIHSKTDGQGTHPKLVGIIRKKDEFRDIDRAGCLMRKISHLLKSWNRFQLILAFFFFQNHPT